jgi:hypothetical protein
MACIMLKESQIDTMTDQEQCPGKVAGDLEITYAEPKATSRSKPAKQKCSVPPCSRPRTVLSKEEAIEIYGHKKVLEGSKRTTRPSAELAQKYQVSAKTVRDIWNGKSWREATLHLRNQVEKLVAF